MKKLLLLLVCTALVAACGEPMPDVDGISRHEFALLYAAAWSSQDPERLASFYAEDGVLVVNDGEPAVGREAIEAVAESFMDDFPDMLISVDKLVEEPDRVVFHWRWTGNAIDLRGYEVWTFSSEGLIAESLGVFDQDEFRRQTYTPDD